jgi:hypothetical protein
MAETIDTPASLDSPSSRKKKLLIISFLILIGIAIACLSGLYLEFAHPKSPFNNYFIIDDVCYRVEGPAPNKSGSFLNAAPREIELGNVHLRVAKGSFEVNGCQFPKPDRNDCVEINQLGAVYISGNEQRPKPDTAPKP